MAVNGAERIAAERKRQESLHDWTPEHDDEHDDGSLPLAATAYLFTDPKFWPWEPVGFKPSTNPIRNLEKAGALIAAEIDRLLRKREADVERRLDDMGVV